MAMTVRIHSHPPNVAMRPSPKEYKDMPVLSFLLTEQYPKMGMKNPKTSMTKRPVTRERSSESTCSSTCFPLVRRMRKWMLWSRAMKTVSLAVFLRRRTSVRSASCAKRKKRSVRERESNSKEIDQKKHTYRG